MKSYILEGFLVLQTVFRATTQISGEAKQKTLKI